MVGETSHIGGETFSVSAKRLTVGGGGANRLRLGQVVTAMGRNVLKMGAKRLGGGGCKTSFLIMQWVWNVFPNYDLWAKRLSEIWFECETSFWNMWRVWNVFMKTGPKLIGTYTYSFLFWAQASASLLSSRLYDSFFLTSGFQFIGSSLCENVLMAYCARLCLVAFQRHVWIGRLLPHTVGDSTSRLFFLWN